METNQVIPTPEQMLNVVINESAVSGRDDIYNTTEVMNHRQQTCFSCQYYNLESMTCNQCGCPVVMMSQFNFKQCPKGYW